MSRAGDRQLAILARIDAIAARREKLPKYYECGICGHMHRLEWNGDCREDAERFTMNALDDKYGNSGNWEEVPMPGGEPL